MSALLPLVSYRPVCKLTVDRHLVTRPRFPVIETHGHFADLVLPLYAEGRSWTPLRAEQVAEQLTGQGIRHVVNLDGFWDGFMGLDMAQMFSSTRHVDPFCINFVSIDMTRIDQPGFADHVRRHLERAHRLGARGIKLFKHLSLMVESAPYVYRPGRGVRIDDPRLAVIWQTAAELNWPVLAHIGDPEAFFDPVDEHNERYLELKQHPDWAYHGSGTYTFTELMQAQVNLLEANPKTTFIIPHVGSNAENLGFVSDCLRRFPNLYVDLAARIDELGRQYHAARRFFLEFSDRILFGTDVYSSTAAWVYPPYFTFLETCDDAIPTSRWTMTGQDLPGEILRKMCWDNAASIFGLPPC